MGFEAYFVFDFLFALLLTFALVLLGFTGYFYFELLFAYPRCQRSWKCPKRSAAFSNFSANKVLDLLYTGANPFSEAPLLQDFSAWELFAKMFSVCKH